MLSPRMITISMSVEQARLLAVDLQASEAVY